MLPDKDPKESAAAVAAEGPQDKQRTILPSGCIRAVREVATVIRRSKNRGKSVSIDPPTPTSPTPEQSRPPASTDQAPTDERLTTLTERAKASSHFRRKEVIESLLATLPESEIVAMTAKCDELLQGRRNRHQSAKQDNG